MSMKELRLDLEATLIQAVCGHGHAHYGYFPDGMPEQPSLQALGEAQQAYFDLLVAQIPPDTKTILDVGSGTGANALGLTKLGYELECLCPSTYLNDLARGKLPETVQVHDTMFEDFETERTFDVCMFAESFHYIALDRALAQLDRYAQKGVVIFDYFRRNPQAGEGGTRGTHAEFCEAVAKQGVFEIISDEDLTDAILPTFVLLDHLRSELFGPFADRARKSLATAYPVRSRLAEMLFGKKIDKLGQARGRADRFAKAFEYRFVVMARR